MRQFGIKLQTIDIVLVSHLHGDHYFGLFGFLSTQHLLGRVRPMEVYGPKGLSHILTTVFEGGKASFAYELVVYELEDGAARMIFEDEKIRIETFPLVHKIPTHGYRITQKQREHTLLVDKAKADGVKVAHYQHLKKGHDIEEEGIRFNYKDYTIEAEPERSYAYCSDTMYSEALIPYIKGADLLYHEATFVEALRERANETKHSTASDAALIAKRAEVDKLLLGHLSARYDTGEIHLNEAKPVFANCEVVEDGKTYFI